MADDARRRRRLGDFGSGAGFADALAAGPAADPAGSSLAQTLRAHRGEVRSVTVMGGEAAVGPAALEALRGALG